MMPIVSSHSVMTVGPMIVKIRDRVVGSPVMPWTRPAPIEATPATTTIHPNQRGYTSLSATARPKRQQRSGVVDYNFRSEDVRESLAAGKGDHPSSGQPCAASTGRHTRARRPA
jgi:hypothetical protein